MTTTKDQPAEPEITERMTARKLAITVLAGGPSGEREISIQSGAAVSEALRTLGHDVFLEDISPDDLSALDRRVDCVFIALHGRFGEDGQIQAILQERGLCYAGSGPAACALAMNKAAAKARFAECDLPTPRFRVATGATVEEAATGWQGPVVVKPVEEGSSLACSIVRDLSQLRATVDQCLADYPDCLIEQYVPGREITVGILGDVGLPPIEIRTPREFYDYQAKYVDDQTEYLFDIDLPDDFLTNLVALSVRAHRVLGCRGFSRVDWRVDDEHLQPYLLEVNVIPGLTGHSLLPKAAARAGMSMPMLCQRIVDLAIAGDPAK